MSGAEVELAEAEDGKESLVDAPLLFWADVSDEFAKSGGVDCPDLFDEHPGCLAEQINLWPERGGLCTRGRGRDQCHRSRQQLVGLDNHSVATAALLMTSAAKSAELEHVTPEHARAP